MNVNLESSERRGKTNATVIRTTDTTSISTKHIININTFPFNGWTLHQIRYSSKSYLSLSLRIGLANDTSIRIGTLQEYLLFVKITNRPIFGLL